ncbi:hypothetical protein GCM10027342_33210 [Photobacterium alginatilyticum]
MLYESKQIDLAVFQKWSAVHGYLADEERAGNDVPGASLHQGDEVCDPSDACRGSDERTESDGV